VILYELLTGLRPIDSNHLAKATLAEMIRIIREEEPSKPSTRLSTDEALPSLAALRRTDPRRLTTMLRGELDWVVMKCPEQSRDRRYETASGLARDIERHLANEAVEARPPSAGYQLRKFLSRNRGPALAVAGVLLTLVAGLIGTSWGLVRADMARRAEATQRQRAEAREQLAIDAVKRFRNVVADNPELKNKPELDSLRKTLLKEPQTFFRDLRERLQSDAWTRPEALGQLAEAVFAPGQLTFETGDKRDSLNSYEEALKLYERVALANPADALAAREVAIVHNNIASIQKDLGQPDRAAQSYEQALEIWERPTKEHRADREFAEVRAGVYGNLGGLQHSQGRNDEALASFVRALEIQERLARENPTVTKFTADLALHYRNTATVLQTIGYHEEALTWAGRALRIYERLVRDHPAVPDLAYDLACTLRAIGDLRSATGREAAAMKSFGQAREIQERLLREDPGTPGYASEVGAILNGMGLLYQHTDRLDEALATLEEAIVWQAKSLAAHPGHSPYNQFLNSHMGTHVRTCQGLDNAEVGAAYERVLAILEPLARKNQANGDLASHGGGRSTIRRISLCSEGGPVHQGPGGGPGGRPVAGQGTGGRARGFAMQRVHGEAPEHPDRGLPGRGGRSGSGRGAGPVGGAPTAGPGYVGQQS
jgi:tetratricopeptide (TPR) repeat protein